MRHVRRRLLTAALLGGLAAGCGRTDPGPPAVAVAAPAPDAAPTPAAVTPSPTPVSQPAPQPPPPPPPPTVFPFPADAAGKALPAVVSPRPPAALPVERFGGAPKDRTPPARVVNPDGLGKAVAALPPVAPPRPTGFTPHAPAERVPFDLGVGAADVPARPSFPVTPGPVVRAPDVVAPPPLAILGRQLPDRAGLDDPTADAGGAVIVNRPVAPVLGLAEFLRVALPDPFEFAAQVKPVVPPAAEPGLAPVVVNPMRPR